MGLSSLDFWESWLLISAAIVLRYFVVAGISYGYFYRWKRDAWTESKLGRHAPGMQQIRSEIGCSVRTLLIYCLGTGLFLFWLEGGVTLHYADVNQYGWGYLLGSVLLMLLVHETYFYWTHRLMHHRWLYRWTHKTHHSFENPSPWCAFAFHPAEAVISMGIIPLIIFLIPWHYASLIAFVTLMNVYDVFIHLGYRIPGLAKDELQNTPELHHLHHSGTRGNYGLYFTFWDRIMKTYCPEPETKNVARPGSVSS
jgi:sterol desaturase/sphingolipid hydroxylase (fatty acid hydroxylase superfamily)